MLSGFTSIGEQLMSGRRRMATFFFAMLQGKLGQVQKPCVVSD
jgi:hypothetical protein